MSNIHRLQFVGDVVCLNQPKIDSALQALFSRSDLLCCNFEAPLEGSGTAILKTGPLVQQHRSAPVWLKDIGFNCFSLANNHIGDFGPEALNQTVSALEEQLVLGVGTVDEAYGLQTTELGGVRYGLLAYGENGYSALNGERETGHAWINHPRVNKDIENYAEKVDYLIIQVHAGVELWNIPLPEWRDRYRKLIDAGADIVIGHHPHCLQGVEIYQGKPIYYSLGNFYFDAKSQPKGWNCGGILELVLEEGMLTDHQLYVVDKNASTLALWDEQRSRNYLQDLNAQINDTNYLRRINEMAVIEWEKHHSSYYAAPFNGIPRYTLKRLVKHLKRLAFNRAIDYSMLWHNLFIESNRWVVERAIQQQMKIKSP